MKITLDDYLKETQVFACARKITGCQNRDTSIYSPLSSFCVEKVLLTRQESMHHSPIFITYDKSLKKEKEKEQYSQFLLFLYDLYITQSLFSLLVDEET